MSDKQNKNVREKLLGLTTSLLFGPLEKNEVIASPPVDTYLTGILWPQGSALDELDDDNGLGIEVENEFGLESAIPGYRAFRPSSIGITFSVKAGSEIKINLGETARYLQVDTPKQQANDKDQKQKTNYSWKRIPLEYSVKFKTGSKSSTRIINTFLDPDEKEIHDEGLSLHIKERIRDETHVFTITLINKKRNIAESGPRDVRCLFQAGLEIQSTKNDKGSFVPVSDIPFAENNEDEQANALLYRNVHEYAVGHGIAAIWEKPPREPVKKINTSWMPEKKVFGTSSQGHDILSKFRKKFPDALKAAFLSKESNRTEVIRTMEAFSECYEKWIKLTLCNKLAELDIRFRVIAEKNLDRCLSALERIRKGIRFIQENPAAWSAFALANHAMDIQSRYQAKEKPAPLEWRPFQLAFMFLVIPSLADSKSKDREYMDLLWFPTGGGKTEAYLALTAFQIFYRRLSDDLRKRQGGVDVLMRYTLRLLTVQQFQRAASLIAACDAIREKDARLGDAQITLGLYVGNETTPNRMDDANSALEKEQRGEKQQSTPCQLIQCPVCGNNLSSASYKSDLIKKKIHITCRNKECETKGNPLPILTVDDVIYANPPSLLIGTIDKFAQIPRRTDMRSIFGLDDGLPPGLIIQDELHLISGPLGSMAGLYETIIDFLCTKNNIRPKIIGSTATIGYAKNQVRALFDRAVFQFPPPGFNADDSFFSVRDKSGTNRLYVGISSAGRSPKFALQALAATLLQSAQTLVKREEANYEDIDTYWTCVTYFNSLRELGGANVLMQDDVPRQMQFLSRRLETDQRQLESIPVELSSRCNSRELPNLLTALSSTLKQAHDDPMNFEKPKDTVLASNMISVGIDIPRLGLMVINGQPKSTAEYIQASSRVGRNTQGLVFTLYNFGRPRDLSHFEHFYAYHSALYKNVEATSVTPWSPRARDKALHAVFAAIVRHLVPGMTEDEDAINFNPNSSDINSLLDQIFMRVSHISDLQEAEETKSDLEAIVKKWSALSNNTKISKNTLLYWEKKAPYGKTRPHLMRSVEDGSPIRGQAWDTPNTMREVEPSTAFILKTVTKKIRET